jgi:hypothetical protein
MNRRRVVTLLGYLSFGSMIAFWRGLNVFAQPAGTGEHVERTVAAIADAMFPGDGLPGAVALELHRSVLADADLASPIASGVAFLDRVARDLGASDFVALDETQRLSTLDAAFASGQDGVQPFVLALRHALGTAYYAAPAIKSAFAYTGPLQPNGFADFQDRPA